MSVSPEHLVIAPVLIPFFAAVVLLFFEDRQRRFKATVSIAATAATLIVAMMLVRLAHGEGGPDGGRLAVYLLGNWPPPMAINLVLDRLSALMLLLTALLALPALLFAIGRWHRAGAHFHSLFLFLVMGVNGAFLTGDVFNLFVFFEVLLAASYGLVLHGSGAERVKAGLHYIAINLAASLLFLIGVALIYGVAGTLNMADLAQRIPQIGDGNRVLLQIGAGILGVAFLIKAGMWPLGFWLPTTYSAAPAPVAAVFAVLSKVGVYCLLRLSLLFFGDGAGETAGYGSDVLLYGGMATIVFGAVGVLASRGLGPMAGFSVLVSSGTLLAGIGLAQTSVTAGALFYLVSSTLTIGAFFLLIELVERREDERGNVIAVSTAEYVDDEDEEDDDVQPVGIAIPGTLAVLGLSFAACALLLSGLPPLSGFVAKFAMMTAIANPDGLGVGGAVPASGWWVVFLLIASGFATLIAMSRAGIHAFWTTSEGARQPVLLIELAAVSGLILMTVAMTVQAGPVMRYMDATAQTLHVPSDYVGTVLEAPRAPRARDGGH